MLRKLCNELCIRISKYSYSALGKVAGWAAAKAKLKVVAADAVLLPAGCRAIPQHHYDVNPATLRRLQDGNRAILHQAMQNWQIWNEKADKRQFINGDQWGTKSDPDYWHDEFFPFLNIRTVKKMIADLVEDALLVVDGDWCQPVKVFSGAEQLTLDFGKDFHQPGKVFHSSIHKESNSLKNKSRKQSSKQTRAGIRKDAVADFNIPEPPDKAALEIHEYRESSDEGFDELVGLPTALIEGWTDTKTPLKVIVAQHGKARVNDTWEKAQGFKNRIAGTRTLLAKSPTSSSAAPPSPYDLAKAEYDEWMRKFNASPYRNFVSTGLEDGDSSTDDDLDPDATPEIDVSKSEVPICTS